MEFSTGFLNKLIDSAVTYYNTNLNVDSIPKEIKTIEDAVDIFSEALMYEAHKTMENEIVSNDVPILHAVNLDGKNPGIISGQSKDKYLIHKKNSKPKKEKTQEQIEKEMEKAKKRLEEKTLKNQQKEEEKNKKLEEKQELKENKNNLKQLKSETVESKKLASKYQKEANSELKKFNKIKNPSSEEREIMNQILERAEEYTKKYNDMYKKTSDLQQNVEEKNNNIKKEKEVKKQNQLEKKKILEKKKKEREEKMLKKQLEKQEREKEIANKIDENDMNKYDELFDLAMEAQKLKELSETNTPVSLDNVTLYESPLPFQRHIDSLEKCLPNNLLVPALLHGKEIVGDAFIKLFHGPPGTGKTYRLMQELSDIIKKDIHKKILVCAPSNIATINMYERAKKLKIKGSLVVSSAKNHKDLENQDILNDKVIFSTISMRFGCKLRDVEFTTILMDEAAQCQEGWVWGLLRPELRYIYMAGDPHQLPALVSEDGIKLNHGRSMMERLMSLGYPAELLDTQRRMHPTIVEFSNKNYYQGKLKSNYKCPIKHKIKPFEIINIDSKEERVGTSFKNEIEANKIIELYNKLLETFKNVIVISPYQAQCKLLKELKKDIIIHTVDSFQGNEAEAVILTTVRTSNLGFWSDYRRLNVAMTRAQHVLRVVGNTKAWTSGPLYKLIKSN
jgi:hypothetical protein